MNVFPVSLPDAPLSGSFHETPPVTAIRTQMDQGPDKLRQRSTAGVGKISCAYILTSAQLTTLDTFYTSDLAGGTGAFDFTHPRTAVTESCRFTAPPEYQVLANGYFRVTLKLEVLP